MCGTRASFSRTQTKLFAGVTEIPVSQVRDVSDVEFARLFPQRVDGYTTKSKAKKQPLDDRARWSQSHWRELYKTQAVAALDPNRKWGQTEAAEVKAIGVDAWVERKMQDLLNGVTSSRYLVTNGSPPQAIDRVVQWQQTEKPTICGPKCRGARGPSCDCICEGKFHGASVGMSRTRFAASDIDLKPTEQMASNAARGLELREKHGKGGTAVGVARARDIKNRANLSPSTVRRMHSFFSRHEGNQKGGEDDAGYIAWLLWGGDAGKAWAARKSEQLDKSESARFAAHGVRLPSRKGRLNIDAAMAALQQMGYHLQFNTVRYDSSHHPHWKVTQPNGSVVEMSGQQITDLVYQKGKHMKIGTKKTMANELFRVRIGNGTVSSAEFMEYARRFVPNVSRNDFLPDMVEKVNEALAGMGVATRASVLMKGKDFSRAGAKAAFAINPVVRESLKSHASKMSDLLRQFIAEAKKSLGNRMDEAWLVQQRATVEGAIRELNNGRVAASVNMAREWADEFAQTYLHHEHTRQLAWIARAIAREPAHVAELAKAHNVPMSRAGAKVKFAATVAGAAAYTKNLVKSLGFYPDSIKFDTARNLLVLEFTSAPIIAMTCATKLHYELSKRGFGLHRVSVNNGMESRDGEDVGVVTISLDDVAAKGLNYRAGAKEAFAANNVDLWNFLSKSDFVMARQNANDLANLKKYASMALTMPDFTPPAHQQHGPSLHTMAKDVLADIKNWEQAVYRNKNRSPFSNTGAKAKFGKPRTSTVRRTPSGAFEVVYWDANGKEQSHQLHSSEDRAIAAAKDVARWIDGQFVASRAGAKSTHALPVPTIANPLNRTEHHGDAIAAINAAIKSGNANEARRLFNLYAHTLNSTEKAGVWGIIRKMIGPQFSRAGAKAAFANWQSEVTRKHGVPITEYTAEIGRNQWMIEVAEETGGVVATLYLWNDLRGMERIKSGRLQELQNYAESLSRNKGAKGVANIERRANYSRAGAKAAFSWNSDTAHINELLNLVMRELEAGNSGNKQRAKQALQNAQAALFNLHDSFSRAGTKAKFENYNGLSQWIAKYGNDINDILNASVSAPRLFEIVRGTDPTQVRNTLHFLYQKMKKREIAAPSWFIRAIREANDSFLDGNDVDLFSRAGAKAVMGRTEEEFAEDVQNAAALIASWAKALQTALGLRDYARAKSVVAQIANTATSLSSELKNPATRMSRAGAKSDGLTLAQRIAVAHDAKRMAAR